MILFFLWHIDLYQLCTISSGRKKKKTAKQIMLLSMVQLIILLILKAKKTKEKKTGNLSIKYNLDSAMKIFFTHGSYLSD